MTDWKLKWECTILVSPAEQMFPFPRGLCSPSPLPSSSRPLKGCKLMKKGVKQGLFVPWCRCEPPKRTEAAFCSLRFFKTPPPKLRQSAARLQRRKMIFDNLVFKKRNISSGRQRQSEPRGAEGWESHAWRGEPLLILTKARRYGEERRAEGSWSSAPSTSSVEQTRVWLLQGQRNISNQWMASMQIRAWQVPAVLAFLTQQLPPASAQPSTIKKVSNDSNPDLKKPKSIHENPN